MSGIGISALGAFDLHCDTLSLLAAGGEGSLIENGFQVDAEKMRKGGVAAQFFAVFLPARKTVDPLTAGLNMIDRFYTELARYPDKIAFAGSAADIVRNRCEGRISALLSIEDSGIIGGSLPMLRLMHRLGVRLVTLTWNDRNQVGSPNGSAEDSAEGLTDQGIEFVHEMERLKMLTDVSHLSDAGFYDVCRELKGPFVASHSNARAVTSHCRNLTDDMIRRIADHGGVIGVNFFGLFTEPYNRDDIYAPYEQKGAVLGDVVRHIKHIVKVGGIDCAALGSDFDGINTVPEGLENCARLPALFEALEKAGFSTGNLEKIGFRNSFRVIREVCG
jgi:membrane dipeptidase